MIVRPIRTRVFREGEGLEPFIRAHIPKLKEKSVLVVTSKVVALAESRIVNAADEHTKEKWIKRESQKAIKTRWVWLALKDGIPTANAGVDESNADGKLILLPKNSYDAAETLRKALMRAYSVKNLAVIIPDSRVVPLRAGATGLALGYAGMKGLRDYRGKKDIFGRRFRFEQVGVADGLATAAMIAMGDGAEQQPLAVIEDAPVEFTNKKADRNELIIPFADDMYLPFLGKLLKK